jgi:hypothetical protein
MIGGGQPCVDELRHAVSCLHQVCQCEQSLLQLCGAASARPQDGRCYGDSGEISLDEAAVQHLGGGVRRLQALRCSVARVPQLAALQPCRPQLRRLVPHPAQLQRAAARFQDSVGRAAASPDISQRKKAKEVTGAAAAPAQLSSAAACRHQLLYTEAAGEKLPGITTCSTKLLQAAASVSKLRRGKAGS